MPEYAKIENILAGAVRLGASAVHFDPARGGVRVRFRLAGVLTDVDTAGAGEAVGVDDACVFVAAHTERLLRPFGARNDDAKGFRSEDGSRVLAGSVIIDGRRIVVSAETHAAPDGRHVVLRLSPAGFIRRIDDLKLPQDQALLLQEIIRRRGMICVAGPAGSGRSTFIMAVLAELRALNLKAVMMEDARLGEEEPDIDAIVADSTLDSAGLGRIARFAASGKSVVCPVFADDVVSALMRLRESGIDRYELACGLAGCVGTRVVRILCPRCRDTARGVSPQMYDRIRQCAGIGRADAVELYDARGCPACFHTGYAGVAGVYEVVPFAGRLKELFIAGEDEDTMRRAAYHDEPGVGARVWRMAIDGVISYGEAERVAGAAGPAGSVRPERISSLENRRAFIRLHASIGIQYGHRAPGPGQAAPGATEDISGGGLLFIAKEALSPGSMIEVQLDMPDNGKRIAAAARVVRTEKAGASGRQWKIAVCFLDMSSADRARLEKYAVGS